MIYRVSRKVQALTLLLLVVASLLARSRTGAAGSFWYGFDLFGWVYLLLGAANLGAITFGYNVPSGPPSDLLPVTDWLRSALDRLMARDGLWDGGPILVGDAYAPERYNRVLWIAQFLLVQAAGLAGGGVARYLHARSTAAESSGRGDA